MAVVVVAAAVDAVVVVEFTEDGEVRSSDFMAS